MPISKLAEIEKSSTAAEKRPAEAKMSDQQRSKKLRFGRASTPSVFHVDEHWTPFVKVGDRSLLAKDNALDNLEVGAALSTAVLLSTDINQMAELFEYENYAMIMQHCVLAIQQGHSLIVKIEEFKKKLTNKTKEAAKLLSSLNKVKAHIQSLQDQAKATQLAQSKAKDRAEAA